MYGVWCYLGVNGLKRGVLMVGDLFLTTVYSRIYNRVSATTNFVVDSLALLALLYAYHSSSSVTVIFQVGLPHLYPAV